MERYPGINSVQRWKNIHLSFTRYEYFGESVRRRNLRVAFAAAMILMEVK